MIDEKIINIKGKLKTLDLMPLDLYLNILKIFPKVLLK